jgi:ubiquitin C-terminal hydrolase
MSAFLTKYIAWSLSDIVKRLFEGTLRSVFLCEECGEKRMLHEPFMNISLTLSEKFERPESDNNAPGDNSAKLSVQTCLEHFVVPEKLGDPIDCPHCEKRTTTKKQHTFAKLPKVLCLHLKRFDAARNKKIDEFVSFPAHGLNMGPLLSHWCEVSNVPSSYETNGASEEPSVLYDLFGTVTHIGNMQSGHYETDVKVKDQWYHCSDEHISLAGTGNGEEAVLNNGGAYILFYIRR